MDIFKFVRRKTSKPQNFIQKEGVLKSFVNNNKCYAGGCDHNNVDCSCMYGVASDMPCQVNCYNCIQTCKKDEGVIACEKFKNKIKT